MSSALQCIGIIIVIGIIIILTWLHLWVYRRDAVVAVVVGVASRVTFQEY